MKSNTRHHKSLIVISIIVLCIFLLTKCVGNEKDKTESTKKISSEEFAGSATCAGCHRNIYDSHIHTAHYLTSGIASEKNIKGSFENGKNRFAFNDHVEVAMEKRDSGFYQVAYLDGVEKRAERFDIVVGSATKGQSYLHWNENKLTQLPITYFTAANQWSNSPGYRGKLVFNRPITSRCLECHSTYVQKISDLNTEPEKFNHNRILYGIDCEKCHGPAGRHVEFQLHNPKDSAGKYMINPAALTRQQNLDLCALCHGGRLSKSKPSFGFEAGDKLSDYFKSDTVSINAANIDVHGNQYGLLAASKCFIMSKMTCSSCHNAHENEKGKITLFSKRCMTCHNNEHKNSCKMSAAIGSVIAQNCIDCHMPKQPSGSIAVMLQGAEVPSTALMRTHLIKIYPDETKKVLVNTYNKQSDHYPKSQQSRDKIKKSSVK